MRLVTAILLLVTLVLAGCAPPEPDDGRLRVVCTTGMITDVAQRIGGHRARVNGLMGAGVDPHLYRPSEGDVGRLARADIVFYNGLHLEAKMSDVLKRMKGRIRTVAVTERIPESMLLSPPGSSGQHDPHVWFDVTLWMKAAERIRDAYVEADPPHAADYQASATILLKEMADLHTYVKKQAASIPPRQRILFTAHDAFGYFGRAYGFEVIALQGLSTVTEAGTADVDRLAKHIVERRIPAIFVESSVPHRNVQAVQEAVRARGFEVKIGGELLSDAMGNPGTPAGNYMGMVKHNIDTITKGLRP